MIGFARQGSACREFRMPIMQQDNISSTAHDCIMSPGAVTYKESPSLGIGMKAHSMQASQSKMTHPCDDGDAWIHIPG